MVYRVLEHFNSNHLPFLRVLEKPLAVQFEVISIMSRKYTKIENITLDPFTSTSEIILNEFN